MKTFFEVIVEEGCSISIKMVVNNKVFFGMNNDDFFEVIVEEGCIISIE
jgi:hypothetical protein